MASAAAVPFRRLIARDDFRRNPVKALFKRLVWRLRWLANSDPVELHHAAGFSIAAPKGAAGALIYYLGSSEPESTAFVTGFLKRGMVFFDVGAHIGEYSVLAGSRIGEAGSVHAFEAQPSTAALLRRNCAVNHLDNATINCCAVADEEGEVEFDIASEPSMSAISTSEPGSSRNLGRIRVPATTLDAYCARRRIWPHLLKIDVEGAEYQVLKGAVQLLSRPSPDAPAVLFECLPWTYARFGYSPEIVTEFLRSLGYRIYRLARHGDLAPDEGPMLYALSYNLVALKS